MFAVSLFSRKQGLGIPIHLEKLSISINIDCNTMLYPIDVRGVDYIALTVDVF